MRREISAGAIVFNTKGQVLLVENASLRDPQKKYWGFPKGHLDNKEDLEQTALREVEEETGLKIEILSPLGESEYFFVRDGEKIFKIVKMFLAKEKGGSLAPQKAEINEVRWFNPEEAFKTLTFPEDKRLLQLALEKFSQSGS